MTGGCWFGPLTALDNLDALPERQNESMYNETVLFHVLFHDLSVLERSCLNKEIWKDLRPILQHIHFWSR